MWKKTMGQICPEIHYKKTKRGVVITGCYGTDGQVVLPDEIEGNPVTEIAPYAFAENQEEEEAFVWRNENAGFGDAMQRICGAWVTEIWLPSEVTEIGRYAFYRCRNLKKLILTDSLLDIGGGALTGCNLAEVELYFYRGERCCLKSIVDEMRFAIRARLYYYGRNAAEKEETAIAQVLFPEHYEEAVENTPARILYTQHHGAGGYYRQCFYDRKLDYKKYDELLFRTVAEEQPKIAAELVLNRVRYPFQLTQKAKEAYEQYLATHMEDVADYLVEMEEVEGILFLSDTDCWTENALNHAIQKATEEKKTEVLSILMDEKHRRYPKKKKTFEL